MQVKTASRFRNLKRWTREFQNHMYKGAKIEVSINDTGEKGEYYEALQEEET